MLLTLVVTAMMFGVTPSPVRADIEDEYNLALQFYKQDRWELASNKLEQFLKEAPQDHGKVALAKLYLGQALVHQRKFKEARPVFRDFVKNHSGQEDLPLAMYRVAECSYFLNDLKAAEQELNAFLKQVPANYPLAEWALLYLGETQLQLGNPSAAENAFATGLKQFDKGRLVEEMQFGLARAYEGLDRNDDAKKIYEQLAGGTGRRAADAQFNLAARLFEAKQYQQAAKQFEAISAKFPKHSIVPLTTLNAGYSHYHLNEFPQATSLFEKVRGDAKHGATAEYWIGLSLKSQEKFDEASAVLLAQFQKDEKQPLAESLLFHAADSQLGARNYSRAQELFEDVHRRFPKGELADDSLHLATEAALFAKDFAAARRLQQTFETEYPQSGLKFPQDLLLGRLLLAEGDQLLRDDPKSENGKQKYRDAAEAFTRILNESQIDETKSLVRLQLARAWNRLDNQQQVLTTLKPLIDETQQPDASENALTALAMQSTALLSLKRYEESIAVATEYLSRRPSGSDAAEALANLSLAHARQQQWAAANESLDRLRSAGNRPLADRIAFEVAEVAYDASEWSVAETQYQAVVDQGADGEFYRPAISGLAYALHEQGRVLNDQVTAAQTKGESATGLLAQAIGQFDDAANWFTRLAELSEQQQDRAVQSDALYMKGLSLRLARRLPEATKVLMDTAQQFGLSEASNADASAIKAGYNAQRSAKEAARTFQELQQIEQADAAYQLAYEQLKQQPAEAQSTLDTLINEWALLHYNVGDFNRANALFQKLIDEQPQSEWADDARMLLAESDYFSEQFEPAREKLQALVTDEKTDEFVRERSLVLLMDVAARLNDWKAAATTAKSLAEQFPEGKYHWEAEYRQGEAALRLEDFETARDIFTKLAEQKQKPELANEEWFPGVWLMLAETYLRLKDYGKVEQTANEFATLNPDSPLQYHFDDIRGRMLQKQAYFPEARDAFRKVIESPQGKGTETAAKAQLFIAETYFVEKKYQEAFDEYYRVLLYGFPEWQAAALFQAGKSEELLKRWQGAAKSYRQLLEDHPDSEYADEARQRLADLEKRFPNTAGS